MLNKPDIKEACPDGIKAFLLELVQEELKNIPVGMPCRRRDLCEAILAVNRDCGERRRIRDAACEVLKGWKAQASQIAALEKLGFTVVKGGKHYKLRRHGLSYFKVLSVSPSDKRTGANSVTEFLRLFF